MEANSTITYLFPEIDDVDNDETWHVCDIFSISNFATYSNLTKKLTLKPMSYITGKYTV